MKRAVTRDGWRSSLGFYKWRLLEWWLLKANIHPEVGSAALQPDQTNVSHSRVQTVGIRSLRRESLKHAAPDKWTYTLLTCVSDSLFLLCDLVVVRSKGRLSIPGALMASLRQMIKSLVTPSTSGLTGGCGAVEGIDLTWVSFVFLNLFSFCRRECPELTLKVADSTLVCSAVKVLWKDGSWDLKSNNMLIIWKQDTHIFQCQTVTITQQEDCTVPGNIFFSILLKQGRQAPTVSCFLIFTAYPISEDSKAG